MKKAKTKPAAPIYMTSDELRKFIEQSGMSQEGFARLIGYGGRGVRLWLADELPVPKVVALLVRALRKGKIDPETLL